MNRVMLIFVFLMSVTTVFAQSEFSVDYNKKVTS